MKNKKPLGIGIIAIALVLLGILFLLGAIFFVKRWGVLDEQLISLGLSSAFVTGLFVAFALLAFIGAYGLEKGIRIGWLTALIFFAFFVLMDIAAFFIERSEVKYGMGIISLVALYYLSRKDIRKLYK